MREGKSLLRKSLRGARLRVGISAPDFWSKSVGSSGGVRRKYFEYRASVPVDQNVIFYETMSGARMGDNPFGIYEYLRSHPEFGEFLHVWSIDSVNAIPDQYLGDPNVRFAHRGSASYAYFLATAGRVVCNANLPSYFSRRSGQLYLNTWHGVPYKALGRNTPKARFGAPASTRTFLTATHVLSACEFMTQAMASAYSMSGASTAMVAETGYPRIDLTINMSERGRAELRNALGIENPSSDAYRPTVLYAPTWRADNGEDVVDSEQLMDDIAALADLDVQLMYRGHHRMDRVVRDAFVGESIGNVIIPPHEISSNELMSVVDILITDYSSIFFDFLPTGRPVVHYLYDLDEYTRSRGLNLSADELPGAVARSRSELVESVGDASAAVRAAGAARVFPSSPLQGEKYRAAQLRFAPHEDGLASKRAVDFFISSKHAGLSVHRPGGARPSTVFWAGGLGEADQATEFLERVVKSGTANETQTVVVIDTAASLPKSLSRKIKALGDQVSTIAYQAESPVRLPLEESEYRAFMGKAFASADDAGDAVMANPVLRSLFVREYRKRMGSVQFDSVVRAPGLDNYELALSVLAARESSIEEDFGSRFPVDVLHRTATKVLPDGSARRRFVRWAVRSVRERLG